MLSDLLLPYLFDDKNDNEEANNTTNDITTIRRQSPIVMTRKERRLQAKLARRRDEIHSSLTRNTGLPISSILSDTPTCILCLLNAASGGVASVTHQELEDTLAPLNGFVAVHMTLGKPCSFAAFDSIDNAVSARIQLDGRISPLLCNGNGKLLLVDYAVEDFNWASGSTEMASLDSTNSLILSTNEIKAATINIPQVPGLVLVTEYITMEEEKQLLEEFTYDSHTMVDQWDRVQDRFVQHYGHIFDYTTNRVQDTQHPIPKSIEQLLDRLPDYWPRPDQLTVSNYPSGAGIPPHVDSHQAFDDTVYSFSLGHPIMMELRPAIDVKSTTTTTTLAVDRPTFVVDLPPRSLLVMRNDARYLWEHSIRARHSDLMPNGQLRARQLRVSFTMRPINRRGRCQCPWPDICQLRNKGLPARDE